MMKRILSLLLAFLMVVSILPTPTHAEDTAGGPTAAVTEPACPTCGKSGCTSSHENWCRICLADNCGVDHSKKPAETQASADEAGAINEDEAPHPMVGKIVMLAGTVSYPEVIENPNISVYGSMVGVSAFPERMEIESVVTIGNVDYYQLEAAAGYTWPEYPVSINEYKCYEHHWLKSSQVALAEESEPECPVCGEPGCTAQHKQCEICGKYDCTKLHFWCDRCGKYDCGKSHLICPACGNVDCTKNHVFCGYCGTYNDCEGHDFAPAVEAELPENPVLTEGADVSIVDENGQPATSFRLTEGSKSSISAWSTLDDSSEAAYQWQICYDDENDLWTNIQGQTGKGLLASPAMFQGVLERLGSATVRCVMTVDGETKISTAIPVAVVGQQMMASYGLRSGSVPLAEGEGGTGEDLQKSYVVVQYVYADGRTAASSDFAEVIPGTAIDYNYTLPKIVGYKPVLKNASTLGNHAAITDGELTVTYAQGELEAGEYAQITVEYQPDFVNVTVIHYWQNVDNDNYVEHERETVSNKYRTGDVIANAHKSHPGFYNLLYETPAAAADGSTVIEVYYDRYYYLMKFDLGDMGYGVDPIYARYGADVEIRIPTRPGYEFAGWMDESGNAITVPSKVPEDGGTYTAKWTAQGNTQYTVAYWIVNDDGTRTLIGTKAETGTSNSTVSGQDDVATLITCEESEHTHTAACYSCGHVDGAHTFRCYAGPINENGVLKNENDLAAIMAVNGNQTPENGTLYLIQSPNDIQNDKYWPKLYLNGKYYNITVNGSASINSTTLQNIVDGAPIKKATATYTATQYKARVATLTCTSHSHTDECFVNTRHLEYLDSETDKGVTIKGDGSTIVNVCYQYKEYTLKFYYAAEANREYKVVGGSTYYFGSGTRWTVTPNTADDATLLKHQYNQSGQWGKVDELPRLNVIGENRNYQKGSVTYSGVTYHYISFTARYGDDISDMWPCAVFYSVTRTDKNNANDWAGTEAFFSAWNGEYRVKYSQDHAPNKDNENQTIKGVYEKLDDDLLFAPEFEDSTEVSYLCFWENGANIGWSVPDLFRYKIWVEALPYELNADNTHVDGLKTRPHNGVVYKQIDVYDTCDNSTVDQQTQPGLTGYDKNGYTSDTLAETEYDEVLYRLAYEINFFYLANRYKLRFWNYNDWLGDGEGAGNEQAGTGVAYGTPLQSFGAYVDAAFMADEENYPETLESNAYKFAGWYTTAECLPGTEMDWENATMPDADMTVYAKWVPISRTVRFYLDKTDMNAGVIIPERMDMLWQETHDGQPDPNSPYVKFATKTDVPNKTFLSNVDAPSVSEGYENHPYNGYTFVGWFYLDNGVETAFAPKNMPVTQDLDLYGKWSADKLCLYNVHFALDIQNNETGAEGSDGIADVDAYGNVIYIADPISGSAIAGRTYTFSAKGGEELYENYREGYFPTAGSHSITIDIADTDGTEANSHTFLYQQKSAVRYTVKYVVKETGETLFADKVVADNKNVVVTENFRYKQGYMPDAYQKTLIVTDDGNESNDVIIFYYTKDEQHALYVINYYIQELDENLNHRGWSKYTDLQTTGTIGTTYSAEAITIDGFTLSQTYTDDYNTKDKINGMEDTVLPAEVGAMSDGTITGKLTDKGMELNFYYTRNLYPYEFRYMLNGTTTQLAEPKFGMAGYDTYVTGVAQEIVMDLDVDGINEDYRLYDPTETTKDIHIIKDGDPLASDDVVTKGQATVNVATFYYVRCTQTMTITKEVVDEGESSNPNPNQEFNLSLLIHAKNGYHRTEYTYKITEGENEVASGTLSPAPAALNTLQFILKAGQKITIEGLPTAEYTVSERNLPTGYYDTTGTNVKNKLTVDGQLDVTVTNTYDPALLSITKTVDVVEDGNVPEVEDFEFTVRGPIGAAGSYSYTVGSEIRTAAVTEGTMTLTLKRSETATFLNLPTGTYTVTETDYSAKGYNSNYKVNDAADYTEGSTSELTLERGKTQNVEFMNIFPVGDLTIEKTVNKEFYSTAWNGDTFTFTVERTTENRPLLVNNQYKILVDDVEQSAGVVADADGKLTVSIAFSEADAQKLTSASSSVMHILVIKNLPAGTYRVTENSKVGYEQSAQAVDGLTIPAENVKASFTNELKRKTSELSLEKILVAAPGYTDTLPEGTEFSFEINLLESVPDEDQTIQLKYGDSEPVSATMASGSFIVKLEKDQTVVMTGLPEGKYRITEATIPSYANDFSHWINNAWVDQNIPTPTDGQMYTEIDVFGDGAKVKCTNTYPVDRAELMIQKQVTKEYPKDTLPDAEFTFTVTFATPDSAKVDESYPYTIYNADGTQYANGNLTAWDKKTLTVSLKDGQYVLIQDMPVCDYTVSETGNVDDYNTSYEVYVIDESSAVQVDDALLVAPEDGRTVSRTFLAGKTDKLIFTNQYKRHLGTLTITKTGAEAIDENQSFVFTVTSGSISIPVVLNSENKFKATLSELPFGTYTITEDSSWSWRYTLAANQPGSAEINAQNLDVTVEIANVRTKTKWLNGAAFESNWFTASTK